MCAKTYYFTKSKSDYDFERFNIFRMNLIKTEKWIWDHFENHPFNQLNYLNLRKPDFHQRPAANSGPGNLRHDSRASRDFRFDIVDWLASSRK